MQPANDPDNPEQPERGAGEPDVSVRRIAILDNRIDSKDLFVSTRDLVIVHGTERYHLRLTSQNKLILTK